MDSDSVNDVLLAWLYERYEQLGAEPPMLREEEWGDLVERTKLTRPRIGRGFEELVPRLAITSFTPVGRIGGRLRCHCRADVNHRRFPWQE